MDPSIDSIKASDGSAPASVATVQTVRAPLAATIIVNTVSGINANFHGSMGTPHTFTDPVTSETITVISEATNVDFRGHVDGSDLVIDEIAAGFTDLGSEVGDIIIIKPTTQWGDEVARVLEEAHQDDGKLKTNSLDLFYKPSDNAGSWVVSGGIIAQSAGLIGTFSDIAYYVLGLRYTKLSEANKTYIASKDTYVDIGIDGVVDYNDVANGAAAPTLAANHIRLAKVVTNGSAITSVTQTGIESLGNSIYPYSARCITKYFTTAGANTWTKPEGLKYVIVEVQAGGGGGGGVPSTAAGQVSSSGGGGGGAYGFKKILAASLGATETVTVGAGGAGGAAGLNAGTTGTNSSFGAHVVSAGGAGGSAVAAVTSTTGNLVKGGDGGLTSTGADRVICGSPGIFGIAPADNNNAAMGGSGGSSYSGGGGVGRVANSVATAAIASSGAGGSGVGTGASQAAKAGGNGGSGIIIVHEYF